MSHNIHSAKVLAAARAFVACAGSGKEGEPWADMEVEGLRLLRSALDKLDAQGSPAIASDPLADLAAGIERLRATAPEIRARLRAALDEADGAPAVSSRELGALAFGLEQALAAVLGWLERHGEGGGETPPDDVTAEGRRALAAAEAYRRRLARRRTDRPRDLSGAELRELRGRQ